MPDTIKQTSAKICIPVNSGNIALCPRRSITASSAERKLKKKLIKYISFI
jgi:hypothetical protein